MIIRRALLGLIVVLLAALAIGIPTSAPKAQIIPMAFWQSGALTFATSGASVRFRAANNACLTRTMTGSSTTWSLSMWVKSVSTAPTGDLFHSVQTTGSGQQGGLGFSGGSGRLNFYSYHPTPGYQTNKTMTGYLRDPTSWYHLVTVWDTNNTVAEDRMRLYVNGVRVTSFSPNVVPATLGMSHQVINNGFGVGIGCQNRNTGTIVYPFDGYMADVKYVDAQALTPSAFGQMNSDGIWVPKAYTGTYNASSFWLKFLETTATSGANTGFGKDSWNSNYWNSTGLNAASGDAALDSPELQSTTIANYATWNPLSGQNGPTYQEGNTGVTFPNSGNARAITTFPFDSTASTGTYWDIEYATNAPVHGISGLLPDSQANAAAYGYGATGAIGFACDGNLYVSGVSVMSGLGTCTVSDRIGYGVRNGNLYLYKNGVAMNSGNPVRTGLSGLYYPAVWRASSTAAPTFTIIAGGERAFPYGVPANFVPLNTFSMATPTLTNSAPYFKMMTYTGNGAYQAVGEPGKQVSAVNLANSVRLRLSANAYLTRTPASAGNGTKWTWSGWLKPQLGVFRPLISAGYGGSPYYQQVFGFNASNQFQAYTFTNASGYYYNVASTNVLNDPTQWHHVVIVFDLANADTTKKLQVFVDGRAFYNTSGVDASQAYVNSTAPQYIGAYSYQSIGGGLIDGYLADVYMADGYSLPPTDFGTYNNSGVWVAKAYTGSYGTNGYHLDFSDNTNLGKDVAGTNNWTPVNISSDGSNPFVFQPTGFKVGSNSLINTNANNYISWNWKKGTTPGFDVVQYAGSLTSAGSASVNHSLGAVPAMVISKSLNPNGADSGNWYVWHQSLAADRFLRLNTTDAAVDSVAGGGGSITLPNNSRFFQPFVSGASVSGNNYVAYAFAQVPGFSRFGSYVGNGSANGPFVYTGFKPAYILFKDTNAATGWMIYDSARSPNNSPNDSLLRANDSAAEGNGTEYFDLVSNGFKIRYGGTWSNVNGNTYVYAAFAESPFKEQAKAANLDVLNGLRFTQSPTLTYLYQNRTSAVQDTNTRIKTYSFWVKRSDLGRFQHIITNSLDANFRWQIDFTAADQIQVMALESGSYVLNKISTAVFRDPSSWYHIVVAADTTNASVAEDRIKVYVNGVRLTSFGTNTNPAVNNLTAGLIMSPTSGTWYPRIGTEFANEASSIFTNRFTGYLAEFNLVDGQALAPAAFGEANSAGLWVPKTYAGTYGASGFYLTFANNSAFGADTSGASNNWTADGFATSNSNPFQFKTTGFQLGSNALINTNADNYISWNWKKGTTPGFDIVTYAGNGTNGRTVPHGLGVAPAFYITKNLDGYNAGQGYTDWNTYHKDIPTSGSCSSGPQNAWLHSTLAVTSGAGGFCSVPTSSVFSPNQINYDNTTGKTYVAYLFSEVAGFSKFGKYMGNGTVDGPFVYTGFKPAFVMRKRIDSTGNWTMVDGARSPENDVDDYLWANMISAEMANTTADIDFLSNGFKIRSTATDDNASGGTYIYAAFAEVPFKEQSKAANLDILNGLRFNSSSSAYLSRTHTLGDRQKWTFSTWFKQGSVAGNQTLFSSGTGVVSGGYAAIRFNASNQLEYFDSPDGSTDAATVTTTSLHRDPSVWKHLVVTLDTAQATTGKLKIWVNGVQQTLTFTTYPTTNQEINRAVSHAIGRFAGNNTAYFDGYMSDMYFVDGQALTPASFGEANSAGLWAPKTYSGTYGTNGFHLDFADSANLGKDVAGSNNWTANNFTSTANSPFEFKPTGFKVGVNGLINTTSDNYVSWNWKKGVTPGFDIVSYTGTGANRTVAHALGSAPSMMIIKRVSSSDSWIMSHKDLTSQGGYSITLNAVNAEGSGGGAAYWNNTAPTSSVFSLATDSAVNASGSSYIAYLFTEVPGFSKFGKYAGNGSVDGPFVYTGFKPAFILVKDKDGSGSWTMMDSARTLYNPVAHSLFAEDLAADNTTTRADLLSNGFKIRDNNTLLNASGHGFIYAAFAESPFKEQSTAANLNVTAGLRFYSSYSPYLSRTPSVAGNRKTWTWSAWVKRSSLIQGASSNCGGSLFFGVRPASGANVCFEFWPDGRLNFFEEQSNTLRWKVTTNALYRDPAQWMHVVLSFDDTPATPVINLYVNGVQITSFSTFTLPTQNYISAVTNAYNHTVGGHYLPDAPGSSSYFNGYMSDVYLVDGQALPASTFGETNAAGIWMPKTPSSLTYGTTGFHLQFLTATTPYVDTSGNANNFTSSGGLTSADTVTDSPTNNFATLNPLYPGMNVLEGSLLTTWGSGTQDARSTMSVMSGKWYFEMTPATIQSSSDSTSVGVKEAQTGTYAYFRDNGNGMNRGTQSSGDSILGGARWTAGVTYGFAFDADAGTLAFYDANVLKGTQTLPAGTTWQAYIQAQSASSWRFNFGQGGQTGLTYNAASGGTFKYAPPTGFKAWNTTNLPASAIQIPSQYFKAVTYTGTNASQTVAVGFQPDLTWIKDRTSATNGHALFDSVRSDSSSYLQTNTAAAAISLFGGTLVANMTDTPTNNFATLNPLHTFGSPVLSAGNLVTSAATNVAKNTYASIAPSSGKWYWEYTYTTAGTNASYPVIGVQRGQPVAQNYRFGAETGYEAGGYGYFANGRLFKEGVETSAPTWAINDVIGMALDIDSGTLSFYKNGTLITTYTGLAAGAYHVGICDWNSDTGIFNFGQGGQGGLTYNAAAGGSFKYTPPSGFKALSTTNMATSAIQVPSQYFAAKTYAGTNALQTVTVGFQPDLTWIKDRTSATNGHALFDSSRSGGSPYLQTNTNAGAISLFDMSTIADMKDTPTNNYATLNPLVGGASSITYSRGNLGATSSINSTGSNNIFATIPVSSGKWYVEFSPANTYSYSYVGFAPTSSGQQSTYLGGANMGCGLEAGTGTLYCNGSNVGTLGVTNAGQIMMLALDMDNGRAWWGVNGAWFGTGSPSAGTSPHRTGITGEQAIGLTAYSSSGLWSANFGQRGFAFTPPTGFNALNTNNLTTSAVQIPSQYFAAKAYTGTTSAQTVNVGFQPDLTWIKDRTSASNGHVWEDSARVGSSSPYLQSNTAAAQINFFDPSTADNTPDVPTAYDATHGNYPTLNPLTMTVSSGGNGTLSEGNLKFTGGSTVAFTYGTLPFPTTGKYYWEAKVNAVNVASAGLIYAGFGQGINNTLADSLYLAYTYSGACGAGCSVQQINNITAGSTANVASTGVAVNDVFGFAVDMDTGNAWVSRNGVWFASGNPSAGTSPNKTFTGLTTTRLYPWVGGRETGNAATVNFGQRPFTYTPPTGFNRLQSNYYTNSGFMPDLTIIKNRTGTAYHWAWYDSARGPNLEMYSSSTGAQQVNATGLLGFQNGGFNLGSAVNLNTNAVNYVSYMFKKGATPGFDVVSWTGDGTYSRQIPHSLGAVPKMIIQKSSTETGGYAWNSWHVGLPTNSYNQVNSTVASDASVNVWPTAGITSTYVTTASGTLAVNNLSGQQHVAYIFAEVSGFSKFGTYTGNGLADGTFVYTGFKPAFVLYKRLDTTGDWGVLDNARNTGNPVDLALFMNSTGAESGAGTYMVDFVSNGFKVRNATANWNASGGTYIYAAFAESPFKGAPAK